MKKEDVEKITPLSVSLFFISLGCVFSLLQVGEKMNSPGILRILPTQADTPPVKPFTLQQRYPAPTRRDRQGTRERG